MPQRKSPQPKVLVIGCSGFLGVRCLDWTNVTPRTENIADYDIIFVNSCSLADLIADANDGSLPSDRVAALKSGLAATREGLAKALKSRARVYCIVGSAVTLWSEKGTRVLSSHDWLPLPIEMRREPGDTLTFADINKDLLQQFRGYLDNVGAWEHVFSGELDEAAVSEATGPFVTAFGTTIQGRWIPPKVTLSTISIATDRQDNPVALICWYNVFTPTDAYSNRTLYQEDPALQSGLFVVFVPPTQVTCEEGMHGLITRVLGIGTPGAIPDWADDIVMPGDAELSRDVAAAEEQVEFARTALEGLLAEQERRRQLKSVLWEKGAPLQEACRILFEAVGINTEPSPVSDEFTVGFEGQRALIEVSGSKKSVSQRDVSQLQKDMASYFAEYGEPIKGIFVGNSWKDLPVRDRDTGEKALFPDNVKKWAANQKITLLSTVQLFDALSAHASGALETGTIFQWMMTGAGEIKLVEIPGQTDPFD
jgi:hypothetical protein